MTRALLASIGVAMVLAAFPLAGNDLPVAHADTPSSVFPAVTTVTRPIDHAITMTQAVALGSTLGEPVLAYRYENDFVIGEYVPSDDFTPAQFDAGFLDGYGTQAQVVAFVVERPTVVDSSGNLVTPDGAMVVSNLPVFKAAVGSGTENAKLRSFQARAAKVGALKKTQATFAAPEWRPNQVETTVTHHLDRAYFESYIAWVAGASPHNVPNGYGIEVGVDLWNNAGGGSRPYQCTAGYKDQFFAKNYGYSWSVLNSDWTALPKSIKAYADVNDLFDTCNRNSMSIGIASPKSIPLSPNNEGYAIIVSINAKKGTQSSNVISGQIDLVDDAYCGLSLGTTSLTDCMGAADRTPVDTTIPTSRATLGKFRGWTAPDRCWMANEFFGTAGTPTTVAGGPTGCGY